MKIGIIGAMAEEVEILRNAMQDVKTTKVASCTIYEGKINQIEVALLQSGIGKVAAAMGTTALLQLSRPDVVINTGSAGGVAEGLAVGDIIISSEVRYHDADTTAFGYEIGQLPNCPPAFIADTRLVNLAEETVKKLGGRAQKALICTGDAFVNGGEALIKIKQNFPAVAAVEMEAAAIAQVCHSFDVPFVVVRAISDAGDGKASMSFEEFLPLAAKNSSAMVLALLPQI